MPSSGSGLSTDSKSHSCASSIGVTSPSHKMEISALGHCSKSGSMLDLWVYENRRENLAFTERLEKKNWEGESSKL
jgi:hypothetical protein